MVWLSNPLLVIVFISAEILFFYTFFWSTFSVSCSVGINLNPISASLISKPDPNDLAYTNSVLLSNSGISLSVSSCSSVSHNISFYCFVIGLEFISLQVLEFHSTSSYLTEYIMGCNLFLVTGLHLFHVIVGIFCLMC